MTEDKPASATPLLEGILNQLRYPAAGYTRIEGLIASAILGDPEHFTRESIDSFAKRTKVSTGSVSRFTRLMGFRGFRDLKMAVAREVPAVFANKPQAPAASALSAYMDEQVRALLFVSNEIDPAMFTRAADAIARARAIDISATGSSASIAHSLLFSLTLLGFRTRFLQDSAEQSAAAAFNTSDDVLIAVSFSGRTRAVVDAAARAAGAGATVVALTCNQRSPLLVHSSIALVADARKATLGAAEWPFRTALHALARALTVEVTRLLLPAERERRRQTWTSGRFGIRYEDV